MMKSFSFLVLVVFFLTTSFLFSSSTADLVEENENEIATEEHAVSPIHHNLHFIYHQKNSYQKLIDRPEPVNQRNRQLSVHLTEDNVPILQMAILSLDGRYCLLTFSTPTDKAGYSYNFPCTTLLSFNGDNAAKCYWQDSLTIVIYPDLKDTLAVSTAINVGTIVMLNVDNNITSICPIGSSLTDCTPAKAYPQTVIVEAPQNPVIPKVVVAAADKLSSCSPWTVDLTSSSGDGGRGWSSTMVVASVWDSPTGANATVFQRRLLELFTPLKPFTIPSNAFVVGTRYEIDFQLCNLFFRCAWKNVTLDITTIGSVPPTVLIVGGTNTRNIYTTLSFTLTANAYIVTCSGGQDSSALSYRWFIVNSTDYTEIGGLKTFSKTPSNLLLPPYTLQGPGRYIAVLEASDPRSGLTSQAQVPFNLLPSPLVASLQPASQQLVKVGKSVIFSGAASFDPDAIAKGTNGMIFTWSCSRVAPTPSALCTELSFSDMSSLNNVRYQVTPLETAVNGSFLISMVVMKGTKNTTTSVSLKVIPGNAPLIKLVTDATTLLGINPQNRLLISAKISSNFSCFSIWKTTDLSLQSKLASSVLVALSYNVPAKTPTIANLYLMPNVLLPHSSYSFTLSCERTTATVVVTTNGPPVGGIFTVFPHTGIELTTAFEFSTSQWSDTALPITYLFGFISASGLPSTIQGRSEISYTSSLLPGAVNGLQAILTVFNVLNASATLNDTVIVSTLPANEAQNLIFQQLNASSGSTSINSIKQVISVASASLSQVNCSRTSISYCNGLNRHPCFSKSQTCGECYDDYLGDSGDANTACFNSATTTAVSTTTDCTIDTDCSSAVQTCDFETKKCRAKDKTCPDACSTQGKCIFNDLNTAASLLHCSVLSTTCYASCECKTGYFGSNCGVTNTDLENGQKLRYLLLSGLQTVVQNEDPTNETVSNIVSSVSALIQSSFDLNQDSLPYLQTVANATILNAAAYANIDLVSIQGLLSATNIAVKAQTSLGLINSNISSPLAFASGIVSNYNLVLSRQQVAGQSAVSNIMTTFRTTSIVDSLISHTNLTVMIPSSQFEKLTNKAVSSVTTNVNNRSISTVNIQAIEYSASLVKVDNKTELLSNLLQLTISNPDGAIHINLATVSRMSEQKQYNFSSTCLGKD
jgi:hypothetical protein